MTLNLGLRYDLNCTQVLRGLSHTGTENSPRPIPWKRSSTSDKRPLVLLCMQIIPEIKTPLPIPLGRTYRSNRTPS